MYDNPALDPTLAEPFTQADTLRLQRLHNGLSELQGQVDEGTLHPWEAEETRQELLRQRAPLLARQQQAQQAMQQQQITQAMHAHALNESMEEQAANFRAQSLPHRVVPYTDFLTGKTVHLVEDGKGKVRELDFGEPADHFSPLAALTLGQAGGEGGGEFDPEHPSADPEAQGPLTAAPSGPGYQNPALDPEAAPTAEEIRADPQRTQAAGYRNPATAGGNIGEASGPEQAEEPAGPLSPATPLDKPFEQVIYNGGKRTVTRWAGDGTPGKIVEGGPPVGSAAYKEMEAAGQSPGRMSTPALAQWAREQASPTAQTGGELDRYSLSKTELAEHYNRANASIPSLPPGSPPHLVALRDQAVLARAQHLDNNLLAVKRHTQQQEAQAQEARRKEQGRETLMEKHKRLKEEEEDSVKQDRQDYTEARKNLLEGQSKDNPKTPTHDEIEAEARLIKGYRENRARERAGAKAGAVAPGSTPAPVPQEQLQAREKLGALLLGAAPPAPLQAAPGPAGAVSPATVSDRFFAGLKELPAAASRVPGNAWEGLKRIPGNVRRKFGGE